MPETMQQVLRERADSDQHRRCLHDDLGCPGASTSAASGDRGAALLALGDRERPVHVGTLLANSPEMLRCHGRRPRSAARPAAASTPPAAVPGWRPTSGGPTARCCSPTTSTCRCSTVAATSRGAVRVIDTDSAEWAELLADAPRDVDAASRGRRDGHLHADLHLGHQRRPEGRAGQPLHGRDVRHACWRRSTASPPTTSATARCRCSTPTRSWPAGRPRSAAARRSRSAGKFSAIRLPRRHPPVRRDVHELRRQAAGLRPGHAREARRRRQPVADRVRQRGLATATSTEFGRRFGCTVVGRLRVHRDWR